MKLELEGKRVLVAGASRGLGEAIARSLRRGCPGRRGGPHRRGKSRPWKGALPTEIGG